MSTEVHGGQIIRATFTGIAGFVLLHWLVNPAAAQSKLPDQIERHAHYLFYFHGGVVTVGGDNAINTAQPDWGPYQYTSILDSLRKRGFIVVSEIRQEGVPDSVYATRLADDIDKLLDEGVPPEHILTVGASAGNEIVLRAASQLRNASLKFVITGGCWPDTHKQYTALPLYGHFLSIIESTDPHGTCGAVFRRRPVSSFREIKLRTGLSHGFLYQGLREWIDPLSRWHREVARLQTGN